METDVIVVGGGPTGLMLAGELCLAGVRPLVLERQPYVSETPRAYGLGGQILRLLHCRGLLERFSTVGADVGPAARFPFGGVHVDLAPLTDPPLRALRLPQPRLERLLADHAGGLGTEIRRGHEVVGVRQDDATVTVDVRGPDGPNQLTARYLVGCDGAHSRVRDLAGFAFPGTTYPEVNRLGQVTVPDSVTHLDNGDLDVAGQGRIAAGFTRTDRGVFSFGSLSTGTLLVQTTEEDVAADGPMTLTELRDSIRRVLGTDLPLGEPIRLSRYQFQARQAERYRDRRIMLAGDAAHQFPTTGIGLSAGMLDAVNLAWKLAATVRGRAPAGLLDTYHDERHLAGDRALMHSQAQVALRRGHDPAADALRELFQELLLDEQPVRRIAALIAGADIRYPLPGDHPLTGTFAPDLTLHTDRGATSVAALMPTARPILLDLADRQDVRATAHDWRHRVDVHTATTEDRPADAILIRPDAHIAWAATIDEPADTAAPALRAALTTWFAAPPVTG
ncbi:MAG TPA: FAD-dependent monooxygenase [Pseudonocardiaceae bacterium]|nr:FAD-dependent monooxygenase [Pseudonocardiaceae bacterium]